MNPKRMHHILLVSLLVAAAFLVVACGSDDGSSSDTAAPTQDGLAAEQSIIAIGSQLDAAFRNEDAATICGLMDPTGMSQQFGSLGGCEKGIDATFQQTTLVPNYKFDQVKVKGNTAVATASAGEDGTIENQVAFKKVDGEWKIDLSPLSEAQSADTPEAQ